MAEPTSRPTLDAEALADTIDWGRYDWNLSTCESGGMPIYPLEQARADFIKMINDGVELELCTVCKKKHIVPGPPLTVACRDPCGSYLPRWFPRDRYDEPWAVYDRLMNGIDLHTRFLESPSAGEDKEQRRSAEARLKQLNDWVAKHKKDTADEDEAVARAMTRAYPAGGRSSYSHVPYNTTQLDSRTPPSTTSIAQRGPKSPVLKATVLHGALSALNLNDHAGLKIGATTSSVGTGHTKQGQTTKNWENADEEMERGRRLTRGPYPHASVGLQKTLLR